MKREPSGHPLNYSRQLYFLLFFYKVVFGIK